MRKTICVGLFIFGVALIPAYVSADEFADAVILCKGGQYGSAAPILTRLVRTGHVSAHTYLGWMYDTGTGVSRNAQHAVDLYTYAAQRGDQRAQIALALKYWQGDGIARDVEKGRLWLRRAATVSKSAPRQTDIALHAADKTEMVSHDWYSVPNFPKRQRKRLSRERNRPVETIAFGTSGDLRRR